MPGLRRPTHRRGGRVVKFHWLWGYLFPSLILAGLILIVAGVL